MGFLGNDLWLSGHELEPGVKVLDGLLSASEAQSIMDFPFNSDTIHSDLPDFQMSRALYKQENIHWSFHLWLPVTLFC